MNRPSVPVDNIPYYNSKACRTGVVMATYVVPTRILTIRVHQPEPNTHRLPLRLPSEVLPQQGLFTPSRVLTRSVRYIPSAKLGTKFTPPIPD